MGKQKTEAQYQASLKKKLERDIPGCVVLKNDANWLQGVPDLIVLYKGRYAMLEVKRSADAPKRPNQEYYVEKFSKDAFSAFIFPEKEKEVLDELQRALGVEG